MWCEFRCFKDKLPEETHSSPDLSSLQRDKVTEDLLIFLLLPLFTRAELLTFLEENPFVCVHKALVRHLSVSELQAQTGCRTAL